MKINQLVERNQALEDHRWHLVRELNRYKGLHKQAIENQRFRNRMYAVVIAMLLIIVFVLMGVMLWAQSFNQVM